jgi:ethanolamine ammonia-lyase small subunit
MMNEDMLREIVKSVISQINTEKVSKEIKSTNTNGTSYSSCSEISDKEGNDTLVDISDNFYTEKINVINPKDVKALKEFKAATPARIGVGRAGDRPLVETMLRFRADHAVAIDSVFSTVNEKLLDDMKFIKLQTKVKTKDEHITRPDLGRELNDESMKLLKGKCIMKPQIQIIVCDGLSSKAIEANIVDVLAAFIQGLSVYGIKVGTTVFVKYGRVGAMDEIGEALKAEACIMFVGERPGLVTAESMSAYMVYNPRKGLEEAERTVLSNIHKGGTPNVEAGAHLATIMKRILDEKASGINLKK